MSEPTRTHPPDPNQATITQGLEAGSRGEAGDLLAPPGYELVGEIGSGGMGAVYRARDLDLGREVAVKILLPQYAPDSSPARRFVDEARITGRLQHPGIPAIYRVGSLPDGRPFLAMKLIGGRTLDELLKERSSPSADWGRFLSPLEQVANGMLDRLETVLQRGRLLTVFEQIAQAVGYAHQRGVIHRDLKPSNVMVGDFGEVQVLDWGIARSGDRKQPEANTNGEPTDTVEYSPQTGPHTPNSDMTQAGAILGTPAFMPPEQAIGAVDQIGKPSDVFGLGAILCVILTGKPPYAEADAESNRRLAARAKLDDAFARLDGSGAEPELVALAKRCLAAEPSHRPQNAGEVAEAVAVLRADADRRARQAEMDRARAEVKSAEERKRRRVQRALAITLLGLLAVAGLAGWWVDSVRTQRRADQRANELAHEADARQRAADLKTRQLTTAHDVLAAINESQVLREQGWKEADNLARWLMTLTGAESALKRAEGLLAAGEATDELRQQVNAARTGLARDNRDRMLLAELDRIAEENDIRFLMPVSLSGGAAGRYAAAFRSYGIDLAAAPKDEIIAWLKGHRFRDRLTTAIRNWQLSYSPFGEGSGFEPILIQPVAASAAVAGEAVVRVLFNQSTHRAKLGAILDAVIDDSFTREWWGALARKDVPALRRLLARPEFGRMTSRDLSSLADGLADLQSGNREILVEVLRTAYDRFPSEFWVNFRLASTRGQGGSRGPGAQAETIRYLSAAVAARPRSAIARVALGAELWEKRKGDPAGLRMIRSAAELDPTSVWPHIVIGYIALENRNWDEAFQAYRKAIEADPDTGFFMTHTFLLMVTQFEDRAHPPDVELAQFLDDLVAAHPNHPGGYDLRGEFRFKKGDSRAALADYRAAKTHMRANYPRRNFITMQLDSLEPQARWENQLPAVLRGEVRPTAAELTELAGYCAGFEKKYGLAARFAAEALADNPHLSERQWPQVAKFAGWAIQAGMGKGADSTAVPLIVREHYRRLALQWIRDIIEQRGPAAATASFYLNSIPEFAPVRDAKELARLPLDERQAWEKLWAELRTPANAPPPHEKKK